MPVMSAFDPKRTLVFWVKVKNLKAPAVKREAEKIGAAEFTEFGRVIKG